jgi:phenylacetate-CoA ligase
MIWNRAAETLPDPARRQLQRERLQAVLGWVGERVPFYRDRLQGSRVRSLADLADLPFTRKTDLREHYPFGLFAVPPGELSRIHASSGTRGKPTMVGYTRDDLAVWREVMARALVAAGARPGDVLHVAFGYGLFTGGLGFHDGAEHVGMAVVPVSTGNTTRQHLLLQDLRPAGLAATPSFALHVAESLREQGGQPDALGLRYGLFGAEPWTEALRSALEKAWGCPAFDIYGLSEIIGPGVSGECAIREGLHVADDHFLAEVIDPASGAPVGPAVEGELVITTLTKRAIPVIRYRTGDITALNPEPCRCGRTTVRMARVKGRTDDMLIIKGVNVYPTEVESALLAVGDLEPHYQLVVDRRPTLATLEVRVEPSAALLARAGAAVLEAGTPAAQAIRHEVSGRLREAIGLGVEVTLVPPRTLPRSDGKAVRVIELTPTSPPQP